jgi:hypothetical protein
MPRSLIENINGKGKVFEGQEFVADVTYTVRLYEVYTETKMLNGDVSRTKTGGDLEISISPFGSVAHLLGNRLTLHMSDGRKQDFFPTSSNGGCTATGGPYQ